MTTPSPEADRAAVGAAERPERIERITLDSGVVLRIRPVAPMTVRTAAARVQQPAVPIVHIPEKGTDEPNPNDPDYLIAMMKWRSDQSEAGLTVALVLGTEVESIPEGMHGVADEQWREDLTAALALVDAAPEWHDGPRGRYLDWLRLYAVTTEPDLFRLTRILTSGIALSEAEVQAAAASFRGLFAGLSNLGGAAAEPPVDGDRDQGAAPGPAA